MSGTENVYILLRNSVMLVSARGDIFGRSNCGIACTADMPTLQPHVP